MTVGWVDEASAASRRPNDIGAIIPYAALGLLRSAGACASATQPTELMTEGEGVG
jgi:hypothetical protein